MRGSKAVPLPSLSSLQWNSEKRLRKDPPQGPHDQACAHLAPNMLRQVIAVFWDLGGHASFRSVWHNYYSEVQGDMAVAFLVLLKVPAWIPCFSAKYSRKWAACICLSRSRRHVHRGLCRPDPNRRVQGGGQDFPLSHAPITTTM